MGMIGKYARLTPGELQQILGDPALGHRLVEAMGEDEEDGRRLDVDKAWHAMSFFLDRLGFPVEVVFGEQEVAGAPDWGYGPPRYLPPAQVRVAAEGLARIDGATLTGAASRQELFEAGIYPDSIWTRDEDALAYVWAHYDSLVAFMTTAALAGDAVVTWIS
ncbi:YfbM family protein [Streptomyces globisporus]|uniref:YfbM family protein n=1 Tax=Streptomyces globisporus TaxID=1908 RepID=UPI0004CA6D36|nr:YfbM family protein [Streptomyces globisporus]